MSKTIKLLIATILSIERHTYNISLSHLTSESRIEEYQVPKDLQLPTPEDLSSLLPKIEIQPYIPITPSEEIRSLPSQRQNPRAQPNYQKRQTRYRLFQRKY